jgi:energy-coupling factor transport system permease protein
MLSDVTAGRASWLHRLDPRVKLLFAGGALVVLLLYRSPLFMAAALLLLHGLHLSAGQPAARLLAIWKALLPVVLLTFVLRLLFYPAGPSLFTLGPVRLTATAAGQGLALALRILAMAFAVFVWLYTTPQPALIRSFVKLRLPYEWGLVLALALRYIPTFQAAYTTIAQAQQARGLDLSGRRGLGRVRLMMPIFVAMIISSLRASHQLAIALESRAYRPGSPRTTFYELRFGRADVLATVLLLALYAGLIILNLAYGVGR